MVYLLSTIFFGGFLLLWFKVVDLEHWLVSRRRINRRKRGF